MSGSWPVPNADLTGRCFVCGGVLRGARRTDRHLRPCRLCKTVQTKEAHGLAAARRAALLGALRAGRWRAPPLLRPASGVRLDDAALGMAAGLAGLAYAPDRSWRGRGAKAAGTLRSARPSAACITVIVLARPGDAEGYRRAAAAATWAGMAILLLDEEGGAGTAEGGRLRVHRRPLNGDFAAQRNAAQALAMTPWTFHLDADEDVDASLRDGLGHAVAAAERAHARAVGFPRVNRVGGSASVLFPDTQYRLLRREERFTGRVHERPAACADPARTTQWLAGGLVHRLDEAHVTARKARYDAMGQAAAQGREARELLTPLPTRRGSASKGTHREGG